MAGLDLKDAVRSSSKIFYLRTQKSCAKLYNIDINTARTNNGLTSEFVCARAFSSKFIKLTSVFFMYNPELAFSKISNHNIFIFITLVINIV